MVNVEVVPTGYFNFDGRGPSMRSWLHQSHLLFGGTAFADTPDSIVGAEYYLVPDPPDDADGITVRAQNQSQLSWVIFHELQVLQEVPEEVHTYWHRNAEQVAASGVFVVHESSWLASFAPRHLAHHRHYILEFYDHIVEVIARDLIFGLGAFSIEAVVDQDPRFAYAYLRRAHVLEKAGELAAAMDAYLQYSTCTPDPNQAVYAQRCVESLRSRLH